MTGFEKSTLSLFSSGGLGDLAVRQAGFDILVSNELLKDRHEVFHNNFPQVSCISGDIWEKLDEIEAETRRRLNGKSLGLLYATPPCQGMSKNGRGKLLNAIRAGKKPPLDLRNRLIIPTMELAKRLRPEVIILENVPEMASTFIQDSSEEPINIVDYIRKALGPDYAGCAEKVEFADYGVPQRRQRLISVFSRNAELKAWLAIGGSFLPQPTHSCGGEGGTLPWVTVREALKGLPELDAKSRDTATSEVPFHRVPVLDSMKYWWVKHTPPGCGAFDNQCIACGYSENPAHKASRGANGINKASLMTPLFCQECGEILPRPSVERDGNRVLMKGFTSAYRRMVFDKPASALTRNLSYACSDKKLHPVQNRVLSLQEAFRVHSLDHYNFNWLRQDGKQVSDKTIREIIGESIPPFGFQVILEHITDILNGKHHPESNAGPLFCT